MTKVRSREECIAALQADSAWRKKEIVQLSLYAASQHSDEQVTTARRAAFVMIYAHWEGFVKNASLIYFEYINYLSKANTEPLQLHFQLLRTWSMLRTKNALNSQRNPSAFIDLLSNPALPNTVPLDIIDTESNLSSQVLQKICTITNLDYTLFELYSVLIDKILLSKRNSIVHGERVGIQEQEFKDTEAEMRNLIGQFQRVVETAVIDGAFKK